MEGITEFFELLVNSEKLIQTGGLIVLLLVVFVETGIFFGFIFPGDALLFTAGILCGTKDLSVNIFLLIILLCLAAIAGNATGYYTGKYLGKRLFYKKDTFFFKQKHLETTKIFYKKYGGVSLIAGRFIWIVRTFVPILAGAIDMNFWKFNYYNVIGAVIWVGSLVSLGFLLGRQIPESARHIEYIIAGITVVIMTILIVGIRRIRKGINIPEK
jgi:membrane-associated protein